MTQTLDWVSPLRPAATDIAEYTERVSQALAGRYVLNAIGNDALAGRAPYRFEHGPFFNIGNDRRFHGDILTACRATSGVLIAHDYRIQDLIVGEMQAHAGWEEDYIGLMARHYGLPGQAAAQQFLKGALTLADLAADFPGVEIAAENALCVITHNPALADELARRTGLYCAALPLPFPVADLSDADLPDATASVGGRQAQLSLLVFGYLGHNRGLEQVCDLVAATPGVRLDIAGQIGPEPLRGKVERMKAQGCPIVDHGFVREAELDGLIRAADLVVNLRHPSMGEVSGSQLRIFANQGASVVCDTGWYSSLPDAAVFKIAPENMRAELAAIVGRLCRDRSPLRDMRMGGYLYVRDNHSLGRFAAAFDAFMAGCHEALAHGRKVQLAKHMASLYERAGAGRAVSGEALLQKAAQLLRTAD
jgi:hypothetical protein